VSFSVDSGTLLSPASVTDASGVATATLSTGSDKSNRNIKVTVLSGSVSGSIVIPVAGTALAYAGVTTVTLGNTVTLGVKATDSRGAVIANVPVTIRSSLGNALSAASATTDAQGSATVRYTATNAGTDTLTFQAAGASVAPTLQISAENFVFVSPAANTQIVVGSSYPVSVRYLSNGVAQSGKTVLFTATAGTVSPTSAVTDASGMAVTTVMASTAGPAIVQASYTAAGVNAQATLPIEFVAQTPATLVLQVTPTALGPNPAGTTTQQAQVLATVTDANGNPVKGTTVNFTRTSDPSAGGLNQASAVTDSSGQASVQYIAGALTTASNGVRLKATVAGVTTSRPTCDATNTVCGTTTLTVNQSALFIALGTGNTISNLDEQTYKKDWVVYVTDANGVAVPNVSLTIKVLPVGYCRGELVFDGTTWVVPSSARYFANEDLNFNGVLDPKEDSNGNGVLDPGEDANGNGVLDPREDATNGVLDPGEDANGNGVLDPGEDATNGVLDPGNVISVTTATSATATSTGTVKTDSTGRATISLVYAESYAPWVRVKLRAEAVVTGTESSKEAIFLVTGAASDFSSQTTPPAGRVSPFGSAVSSSGTSCLSAP